MEQIISQNKAYKAKNLDFLILFQNLELEKKGDQNFVSHFSLTDNGLDFDINILNLNYYNISLLDLIS